MKNEPWTIPEWMEPYRELIGNTGGNSIEDLMNDHTTNIFNNSVRCGLIIAVSSQVALLVNLHEKGVL